jgi:hypothetical protein
MKKVYVLTIGQGDDAISGEYETFNDAYVAGCEFCLPGDNFTINPVEVYSEFKCKPVRW